MTPIEFGYMLGQMYKQAANPEYDMKAFNLPEAFKAPVGTSAGILGGVGAAAGGLAGAGIGGVSGMFGDVEHGDTRLRKILRRAGLGGLIGGAAGGIGGAGFGGGGAHGWNNGLQLGNDMGHIEAVNNPAATVLKVLEHARRNNSVRRITQ